jgi:micrococcal nuclease
MLLGLAVAVVAVAGGWTVLRGGGEEAGSVLEATVERVVDGDTLVALIHGERVRVRLLNIDAPEHDAAGGDAECLGPEATAALAGMLPAGTPVTLGIDAERRDRYGRLLAGVFTGELLVNAEMARAGWARSLLIGGNDRFYDRVLDAERQAIAAGLGVHGTSCGAAPPG